MVQINIDLTVVVRILRVALRVVEEAISMTRGVWTHRYLWPVDSLFPTSQPKRKPPAGTQKRLEGLKEEITDVVDDLTSSRVLRVLELLCSRLTIIRFIYLERYQTIYSHSSKG